MSFEWALFTTGICIAIVATSYVGFRTYTVIWGSRRSVSRVGLAECISGTFANRGTDTANSAGTGEPIPVARFPEFRGTGPTRLQGATAYHNANNTDRRSSESDAGSSAAEHPAGLAPFTNVFGIPPATRYSLPNMRLPKPYKAAFRSAELYNQQRNIVTYDHGLQSFLSSFLTFMNSILGQTYTLEDYDFTMNFSGATTDITKRYSACLRSPVSGELEIVQSISPELLVTWRVVFNGREYYFNQSSNTNLIPLTEINRSLLRQTGLIDGDNPYDDRRERRAIDLG